MNSPMIWPYRRGIVPSYADATARDAAIPSPSDGQTVTNQQLKSLEWYDSSAGIWRSHVGQNDIDFQFDWTWDAKLLDYSDGTEITSWPSYGLQSSVSLTPEGASGPDMDRDGLWGDRAAHTDGAEGLGVTDPGHSLTELTVAVLFYAGGTGFRVPIAHWDGPANKKCWLIMVDSDDGIRFYASSDGSTTDKEYHSENGIVDNTTPVLAGFSFDNGTFEPYVNGQPVSDSSPDADNAITSLFDSDVNVTLATRLSSGSQNSGIEDARVAFAGIANRAFTDAQWAKLYSALAGRQ